MKKWEEILNKKFPNEAFDNELTAIQTYLLIADLDEDGIPTKDEIRTYLIEIFEKAFENKFMNWDKV